MNQQANRKSLRVYIDMDGVLCDIKAAYLEVWERDPQIEFPQSIPGIFLGLRPIPGALEVVNRLRWDTRFDVWILSAPSVKNPHCYTEKRLWVERHFDYQFAKRLILATDKSLLIGDVLVDDFDSGKGQDRFSGRLLHFGSGQFPNWRQVEETLRSMVEGKSN